MKETNSHFEPKPFVLTYNMNYGVFELSGEIIHFANKYMTIYKEEVNRYGVTVRTLQFLLRADNGQVFSLVYRGNSDKPFAFNAVEKFYNKMQDGTRIICQGSIKYVKNHRIELNVFRYRIHKETSSHNMVYQPIVCNRVDECSLHSYIMMKDNKYLKYCFNTQLERVPSKLQRGDFIMCRGILSCEYLSDSPKGESGFATVVVNGFEPNTWQKGMYSPEIFKDDEIKSIFDGSDSDLQTLMED